MDQNNWASPAPLGFAAFSMITLVLGLMFSGFIPPHNKPAFAALLLAGAVAQIIAGIIDLRRGEDFAGNLLLTMGCLFMLAPGLSFLFAALKIGEPAPILGYVNCLLGTFLFLYSIPMIRSPWFVFTMGPIGGLGLWEIGLVELGFLDLKPYTAVTMFYLCFWALYMVAHTVALPAKINIPLGKPLKPLQPNSK